MLDLYREFVRDELSGSRGDRERHEFLRRMLEDVTPIHDVPPADALQALRAIHDSVPREFLADPAASHLADLILELERLA